MDARVDALLKARGLRFNPFRHTHSEGDPHLPETWVRTPMTPHAGEVQRFIYGDAGSGKTTQWLRYLTELNEHYAQLRYLAVPFCAPAAGEPATHLAPAMAQAVTASLFTTALMHPPAFDPALATRLAEAFDQHLDLPDWRLALAGAHSPEGVALICDLMNMPRPSHISVLPDPWRALVECPQPDGARAPATEETLASLFDLASAMGAALCVVLADNLGAPVRADAAVAEWAARVWSLRRLRVFVQVQLFLPASAQDAVERAVGPHKACCIKWDAPALQTLIDRRLLIASHGRVADLSALLGLNAQAQRKLIEEAGHSPRKLIALIQLILQAKAEYEQPVPTRSAERPRATVNEANAIVFKSSEPDAPARPVSPPMTARAARVFNPLN